MKGSGQRCEPEGDDSSITANYTEDVELCVLLRAPGIISLSVSHFIPNKISRGYDYRFCRAIIKCWPQWELLTIFRRSQIISSSEALLPLDCH